MHPSKKEKERSSSHSPAAAAATSIEKKHVFCEAFANAESLEKQKKKELSGVSCTINDDDHHHGDDRGTWTRLTLQVVVL